MWAWAKRTKEKEITVFQTRNSYDLSTATNKLIESSIRFTIRTVKDGVPPLKNVKVRPLDYQRAKSILGKEVKSFRPAFEKPGKK
ncbi:MAG TPA: hypothetical protein VJ824_10960 [Bacillota bacterium]|nr:hypothetical protein [Bacillota bacterium]